MYEITSEQYFYVNIVSEIWLDDVFSPPHNYKDFNNKF